MRTCEKVSQEKLLHHIASRCDRVLQDGGKKNRYFIGSFGSFGKIGFGPKSDIDLLLYSQDFMPKESREIQSKLVTIDQNISAIRWVGQQSHCDKHELYNFFVSSEVSFLAGSKDMYQGFKKGFQLNLQKVNPKFLLNQYLADDFLSKPEPSTSLHDFCKFGPGGFHQLQLLELLRQARLTSSMQKIIEAAAAKTAMNLKEIARLRDHEDQTSQAAVRELVGELKLKNVALLNEVMGCLEET